MRLYALGLPLLGAIIGCTPDPEVRVEYEPYTGEAYPDIIGAIAYPPTGAALVTDSYSDTISLVDIVTGQRIASHPVGRNPVDIDGPHHVTVDPAGRFAYIALSYPRLGVTGPHASHGSSSLPGYLQKLSLDDLRVVEQVRVDPNPGDVVLTPDATRALVSHFDLERATKNATSLEAARATLAVVDTASFSMTKLPLCVAPHGITFLPGTPTTALVTCYGEDSIALVDLDMPGAVPKLIPVGAGVTGFGAPSYGPYAATLSADGEWIVVSNTVSKQLRFFDVASRSFDADQTITTIGAPFFAAYDPQGMLVVPTQQPDAVVRFDPTGVAAPETQSFGVDECLLPHEVVPHGGGYFVVCEGDKKTPGKVVRLDASLEIVASTDVGVYPDALRVFLPGAP